MKKHSHWPISILSGFSSLINLALPMVMARLLSAEDIGTFRIFFLYLTTVPYLSLGIGMMNGLFYWGGMREKGAPTIRRAWGILLSSTSGFTALAMVIAALGVQPDSWSPTHTWLFVASIAPSILCLFLESSLIATGRIWRGAILAAISEFVRTGLILAVVIHTHQVIPVLWTHAIVSWIRVAAGYIVNRRAGIIGSPRENANASGITARSVLDYALPISFSAIFDLLVLSSDRFILSAILGAAKYAVYSIGCLAVPPLQILEQSVNKVMIPRLSEHLSSGDRASAARLYRGAVDEVMLIVIPAVCGMILFAEPIIALLFTQRYIEAAKFLQVYAVSYLLLGIPHDAVARSTGDARWILRTCVSFGLISLSLGLALAHFFGPMGALVSSLIVMVLQKGNAFFYMRSRQQWTISDVLPLQSLVLYTGVSVVLGTIAVAGRSLFRSDIQWLLIGGGAFTAAYFAIVLGIKHRRGELILPIPLKRIARAARLRI